MGRFEEFGRRGVDDCSVGKCDRTGFGEAGGECGSDCSRREGECSCVSGEEAVRFMDDWCEGEVD